MEAAVAEMMLLQDELIRIIQTFYARGWAEATSTNYSFRHPRIAHHAVISRSGVDKAVFTTDDLMIIDENGAATPEFAYRRPSAETLIHTMLYALFPSVGAILHTHSVPNTVLSRRKLWQGYLRLEDYEMLKALEGVTSHAITIDLPIFENSQDIAALSQEIQLFLEQNPQTHGFLLSGHGLYTWAKDLATAKRQVEALEFLFECEIQG